MRSPALVLLLSIVSFFGEPVCAQAQSSVAASSSVRNTIQKQAISSETKESVRAHFDPSTRSSDGTWTGGGGEGHVCFASGVDVSKAIDADGRIRPEYRSAVQTVRVLDAIEFEDLFQPALPRANETALAYLERRISENIEGASPYFANRLRQAIALITAADDRLGWDDRGSLVKLNDSGERGIKVENGQCRFVNLVIRYERQTESGFPEVFIDYDRELVAKAGATEGELERVFHEASLIMHEALYMAGVEIGHADSSRTRKLTAFFLSEDLSAMLSARGPQWRNSQLVTALLAAGFNDHAWLFINPRAPVEPFSKASRQKARAQLAVHYRQNIENLRASGVLTPAELKSRTTSLEMEIKIFASLEPMLDPEEAFIYMVSNEYNARRSPYHIDTFLLNGQNDSEAGRQFCRHLSSREDESKKSGNKWAVPALEGLMQKALSYCRSWGKLP